MITEVLPQFCAYLPFVLRSIQRDCKQEDGTIFANLESLKIAIIVGPKGPSSGINSKTPTVFSCRPTQLPAKAGALPLPVLQRNI
ncbi:unnamed protein product [Coccothraustes coccothraustes]